MKRYLTILTWILLQLNVASAQTVPAIESFTISACKKECYIDADLISMTNINGTLCIEAGINLNCCENFRGSFDYSKSDTLNLIIEDQPDENGVSTSCSCNCYYVAQYKILNAISTPKIILINGKTFEENRKDAGWVIKMPPSKTR